MTSRKVNLPTLNGLILSGGKSARMGQNKALLKYHDVTQLAHLTSLLAPLCEEVFVSAKHKSKYPGHSIIEDKFDIESPLNGILSAITSESNKAWLVVACDMPFIDKESLVHLISNRSETLVTCYRNEIGMIEPLLSIWEPQALSLLQDYQSRGKSSPRKYLETNKVNILPPTDYQVLTNVNTVEEYEKILKSNFSQAKSSR